MHPMNQDTINMTLRRYTALIEEFQALCKQPRPEEDQRFKAVMRQITAIREMLILNKIHIDEEVTA